MDKFTDLIQQLTEKYGPHAIEATMNAARMDAVASFVTGLICLGLLGGALYAAHWGVTHIKAFNANRESKYDDDVLGFVTVIISGVAGAFLTVSVIVLLLNPWTYVAYSHPDWWIAKQVVLEHLNK
jgi:hypothetical protein